MEEAMEQIVKKGIVQALADTMEIAIAISGKDPYELLSPEQISEETGIPVNQVREIFKKYSEELGVQTYTRPYRVQRINWYKSTSVMK